MKYVLIILLLFSCDLVAQNYQYALEIRENEEVAEEEVDEEVKSINYLYTDEAKRLLKERFDSDYIAGPGFNDDIAEVKAFAVSFAANPSQYRPLFGEFEVIPAQGQDIHSVGLFATVTEDINLVNIVATELLASINANSLYTSFWNNSETYRWDAEYSFWVQLSKAKKMHDTFHFIQDYQTVWNDADIAAIKAWFERLAELAYTALSARMEFYFGADWENQGFSTFHHAGVYPNDEEHPIQDAQGNNLFTIALAQDHFNNRNWDVISYIHDWAIYNSDQEKEHWVREFFKATIKYGLFPDGTFWEMIRNSATYPTNGVWYGWITSGAMVQVAHMDAMANHFPNDRLYDYETTEGMIFGASKDLHPDGYLGTSTTDGATRKSLLTFLKGQTNYYRSLANGGWNDARFFGTVPLDPNGFTSPSVIASVANLYYKDQDLLDYYTFNPTAGYPANTNTSQGWLASIGNDDWGPWGSYIFGAAWFGQENNFFN